MRLVDSRRLTGPNLFGALPGAICDIEVPESEQPALERAWRAHARRLLDAVGWTDSVCYARGHATGISLVLSAPLDTLYAATDVNEAAFECARLELNDQTLPDQARVIARLKRLIDDERKPALLRLAAAAAEHNVPLLVDDDEVSLGYGAGAKVFASDRLADAEAVRRQLDWSELTQHHDVPVALITGTNGKSTTVRLAAAMVAQSGRQVGLTSTDYIKVGAEIVDRGDYSGPGGARSLLRHRNTQVALLEVARGGMLRRGLGVTNASVALVTNVAADHLGEYGIHTVDELRDAKFIVRRGLAPGRPLILNADDAGVVAHGQALTEQPLIWFSEHADNAVVRAHLDAGGTAVVDLDGRIVVCSGEARRDVVAVADVGITMGGAARHNVQNALAATALCTVLGVSDAQMAAGLREFTGGPAENPGRGNVFEGNGVRAIIDFAHNEHGLRAMAGALAKMPAKRRLILLGQAGDRSDALIEGLTHAALTAAPDKLVICRLPGYERGRDPGDVADVIERAALSAGLDAAAIEHADSPIDGTRFALDWAQPGDVLLILALTQRGPCTQLVQQALGVA